MRTESVLLLVVLFTICITASSLNSYATPFVVAAPHPQATFAPPSAQNGTGCSINLADSVNGWQARSLVTSNALATCQSPYRNITFTQPPPSGFSVAWQNLTVSKLTASPDFREVQFASSSASYLELVRTGAGTFSRAAMRFSLPDTANLTSLWLYYSSDETVVPQVAQLQVVSKSISPDTPSGGSVIATRSLPSTSGSPGWYEVVLSKPLNLTKSNYYWIVLNASSISSNRHVRWYYIRDSGGVPDQRFAAAYTNSWVNENILNNTYNRPYLNLMLVLKVLPVVSDNPSTVMTYSSPTQVNMWEMNSGIAMLSNSTRISLT
nr:hypothetical protein [Candidatus Njordarchaeum guaymaensis]